MSRQVWVSGAAGGIGDAVTRRFRAQGDVVLGLDVRRESEGPVPIVACDLADGAQVDECFARHPSPEVVVHCAGITHDRAVWKMSEREWREVLDVNLTGAFNLASRAARTMRERGGGCFVLLSSINAARGKFGQSNYAASKAGLEAFTRNLAIELGRWGVRANAIAPGMVETPMTSSLPPEVVERARAERLLPWAPAPADIAAAVWFLASEEARCITGHVLTVDCGQRWGGR